ncbi:variable surface protein [Plasmodium gonderi]|uniref:Variable surface protein n=1 Tax=Plasmodium gonderi TaxID=77519 RepID=A0A1Y1JPD0_PLAGO|nr:variable surface protein [Plasmodium gonderi]GAW84110.1 variable surface protein [Plasmodium gonderi]
MTNDIYKIAKEFLKYENIMNNSDKTGSILNDANFKEIKGKTFPGFSNIETICKKFDNYTNAIQTNIDTNVSYNSSCIYLYYWLYYYNNNNERNIVEVKKLYDELISADSTAHQELCKTYIGTTITDDVMSKLKDLHVMYTNLDNIEENNSSQCADKCSCANECSALYVKYKDSCELNSYSNFCNELKNVREKYNELSTTKCSVQLSYKKLPLFQKYNITIPIFIPYNSCFQGTIRRKRNKWNNIDEDYIIFQSYHNVSSAAMNSKHNILYHNV